jgi:hypothetical protein
VKCPLRFCRGSGPDERDHNPNCEEEKRRVFFPYSTPHGAGAGREQREMTSPECSARNITRPARLTSDPANLSGKTQGDKIIQTVISVPRGTFWRLVKRAVFSFRFSVFSSSGFGLCRIGCVSSRVGFWFCRTACVSCQVGFCLWVFTWDRRRPACIVWPKMTTHSWTCSQAGGTPAFPGKDKKGKNPTRMR